MKIKKPFSIRIYITGCSDWVKNRDYIKSSYFGQYTLIVTMFWIPIHIHSFEMSQDLANHLWGDKIIHKL